MALHAKMWPQREHLVGAVLIAPEIKPWHGMLGTTFGGNYLACAASLAVLEIMENEKLVENAQEVGSYL
ncbi:MAG: aminotransferase class III-fold pyridoxal phosphate-dependent enzyme, partial [Azonexus sp.]|nr:aminotransferase class III-fold pyridoxal phosphate-dependent enzyme [Azonexus sp.]